MFEFSEELVFLDIDAKDDMDALKKIAERFCEHGNVKESYINAIQEREKIYPTGLPFADYAVAIPHTDVEHVNVQSICVAKLSEPVQFKVMAGQGKECEVSLIVMLAIKEDKTQLEMLQKMISLIQDKECVYKILESNDKNEIYQLLQNKLN